MDVRHTLVPADLVDLALEVVDDLSWHVIAEDLEEVDPLVAGDRLVGGELDALLHVLDLRVLGDQVGLLGLLDSLAAEQLAVLLLGEGRGHGQQTEQDYRAGFHCAYEIKVNGLEF